MNYYYDLLVNLHEQFYEFYEWEKTDEITVIKKTPIYRVTHPTIIDFLTTNIIINSEWLDEITAKTILKNRKNKLSSFLLTDTKTAIFLVVNEKGKITSRSKLLIEDENNINEISNTIPITNYSYKLLTPLKINHELRRTTLEKKQIAKELNELEKNYNPDKCSYLYYEWFHQNTPNYYDSVTKMKNELNITTPRTIHHLSHLLKLTNNEEKI